MAAVTVYEELLTLFRRFGENAGENSTVIEVWRKTLGADDQIVLQTLALLRATLARAMDQINASAILDLEDKKIALTAVRQLDDVINPNLFNRRADEAVKHLNSQKISMLVLLANSMMMEFPVERLVGGEIEPLTRAIDELGQAVRDSNNLTQAFKNQLLSQIGYIKWAVRNSEVVGIDALFSAFGPPLLFLRREVSKATTGSDDELEPKKLIYRQMELLFERIMDQVGQQN
jgi:hypothetical protein